MQAIYLLRATGTVEHILELTIGSIRAGQVAVTFRGRRASLYSNRPQTVIEVSGKCRLSSEKQMQDITDLNSGCAREELCWLRLRRLHEDRCEVLRKDEQHVRLYNESRLVIHLLPEACGWRIERFPQLNSSMRQSR